jgi:hypothetical protein
MNIIRLNPTFNHDELRKKLFDGEFILLTPNNSLRALVDLARGMASDAFPDHEPWLAQHHLPVEDFIKRASPLKSRFTNDARTKEVIRDVLAESGCNLERTYFDVPRLRVVSSDGYLVSGVGYAYKAHRDTWYSSPNAQLNWWLPVYDLMPSQTMSMYPGYWNKSIANTSGDFDYVEWCRVGRTNATTQGSVDTRQHPLPSETVDPTTELRFVLKTAETLLFSAAHLHATAPNNSGQTRFSIDFRTVNLDDLTTGVGAPDPDNASKGTTLRDFIRASDFQPIPEDVCSQRALS